MAYSVYVHIPFCKHRCHYCDFNTYVGKESSKLEYVDAIIKELRIASEYLSDGPLHSIYFGGGTPSLLSISHYQEIINAINGHFSIIPNCEISIEANPGTISYEYLSRIRLLGVNRLSLGVQSTDAFDLSRLDRSHTIDDVLNSILAARKAGFENINLDMIFNLPWQTLSSWEQSLKRAIALQPEHFSLYSLIIEEGTPLHNWHQRGLIECQNEDLEADMYEVAIKMLRDAGYVHYEISNWARNTSKQDFRCIHNMQYWLNLPYLGIGAGAHGYVGNIRTENVYKIEEFISRMRNFDHLLLRYPETPATFQSSEVDVQTQMKDFLWLGLRLVNEGISVDRFYQTYGLPMFDVFKDEIVELIDLGLVRWVNDNGQRLTLTHRGVLLANQVFMRFV
jgi:oxygen-independent coproporphyrinogen III oxidase